jgi:hypothetical protein
MIRQETLETQVIFIAYMAVYKNNAFSRRLPDLVTEELVFVFISKEVIRVQTALRGCA